MNEKKFEVTFDIEAMYVEVEYEGMSEDVYQAYAYTYADDIEEVGKFIADRLKMFTEKTDAELAAELE